MGKTLTFEEFYKQLVSDDIWHAQICFMHHKKNLKGVAQECYTWLLAQPNRMAANDFQDFRRAYQSFLKNAKNEHVPVQLQQVEEPKKEEHEPLTGEARDKWIEKYMAVIQSAPILKPQAPMSVKERMNNDWRPLPDTVKEPSEIEKRSSYLEHLKTVRECRARTFTDAYPDASEEEIQAYLDKYSNIDNPLGL